MKKETSAVSALSNRKNVPDPFLAVDFKAVGLHLQKRRTALHLTQDQVAGVIGKSVSTISRIENGARFSLPTMVRLCSVLKMSPNEMLNLFDIENPILHQLVTALNGHSDAVCYTVLRCVKVILEYLDEETEDYMSAVLRADQASPSSEAASPFGPVSGTAYDSATGADTGTSPSTHAAEEAEPYRGKDAFEKRS